MLGFLKKKAPPLVMEISPAAFDEIAEKVMQRTGKLDVLDAGGTAFALPDAQLVRGPEPAPDPLAGYKPLSPKKAKNR